MWEMSIRVSKDIGLASLIDPKIKSFSDISINGFYKSEEQKVNLSLNIDSLTYDNIKLISSITYLTEMIH